MTVSRAQSPDPDFMLVRAWTPAGENEGDPGESRIVIGTLHPGSTYARITVADTGTGMAAEVLKRIFDPFFTTKARGRGTGLGLSVVQGIVMAYEGALLVTSRPGAGSAFNVYLPLCDSRAVAADYEISAWEPRGHERILVVDDDAIVGDVLTIGLERLGYEAVALNDPEKALKAFTEDPAAWDVVISDQVMPGMKGLVLCKSLKKVRSSLCFILCTGFSEGLTEERALAAGAKAFFLKPVSPAEIAVAIRKLLDQPSSTADNRRSSY